MAIGSGSLTFFSGHKHKQTAWAMTAPNSITQQVAAYKSAMAQIQAAAIQQQATVQSMNQAALNQLAQQNQAQWVSGTGMTTSGTNTTTAAAGWVSWGNSISSGSNLAPGPSPYSRDISSSSDFADASITLRRRRIALLPRLGLPALAATVVPMAPIREVEGWEVRLAGAYVLPDNSVIEVDSRGNYKIDDADAKVVYQANRIREFNPYINASDLLEAFIKEVGVLDQVKQTEVLQLPINAFIHWLVLQAAKKDGDKLDDLPSVESALPALPAPPSCVECGIELVSDWAKSAWEKAKLSFCSPEHMQLALAKF